MTEQKSVAFSQEVGAGLDDDQLPAYEPMLAAYHRAAAAELRSMISDLALQPGARALDVACGDGVYCAWLAEQVGPDGRVVGVDISPAYLRAAERHVREQGLAERVTLRQGDIARLPFDDDSFDLVWCAHSLYSLPDPVAALHEMRRVVRPGGMVAVLENDTLHHMLLPWPAELELAVRQAQLAALEQETTMTGRFYIGRNLCSTFETVGLEECCVTTYTIDRRAPLSQDERTFIQHYLRDVGDRARPHLDDAARAAFDLLLRPESRLYLLDQPGFFMSHLEIVARGVKR
jgi:ubiquinone/menaquinone biosynthesis C-methylase UbiE